MSRVVSLLLVLALATPLLGAEIDSVTLRDERLRNAVRVLDARFDRALREGAERANERGRERGRPCDEEDLYRQLKKAIASPFIGHSLAERLNADDALDRRRVVLDESIYRDLGLFDAISVHVKDLSSVVRIDDSLVGVDKLGHFFMQGWKYFDIAYRDGDGITAAIAWGERAERTYYGYLTTGIYSQADLAVNFDGMRFWLRVLGQQEDPVDDGWLFNRSYVKCSTRFWSRERYWRVRRSFDLRDWVNGGWDEAQNCSRYRDPEIEARVRARVAQREALDGRSYTCPIDPGRCADARDRYGPWADTLLHPRCAGVPPRPSFFDRLW